MRISPSEMKREEKHEKPFVPSDEPLGSVISYNNSKMFYQPSIRFMNNRGCISHARGFTCRQCNMKSKHNSQSGYCYLHKRIVDMAETCPYNSRNTYKNVNFQ
jgi:hypothetical protein